MYAKLIYRKKILLALTKLFGGELSATDFQKLLFMFSQKQSKSNFDFVPYKFGCFSFQSMADKKSLINGGHLNDSKNWSLKEKGEKFTHLLNGTDRQQLQNLKMEFGDFSTSDLIKHVYVKYPYFAIKSEIAEQYLSKMELAEIRKHVPFDDKIYLFTIGYEGRSIEQYLNILIQNNVKILCDVRKNPLSRKYGFAKSTLQNACDSVGIKYIHIPELGIISEKRRMLNSQQDYDDLFLEYDQKVIPRQNEKIQIILNLIINNRRVALTCFEALPRQCHRTKVANALLKLDKKIPLKHL